MTMRDVNRGVALSGWIIILGTCSVIVGAYLWAELVQNGATEKLTGDFRTAIGFMFGAATALVRDAMMKPE